MVFLILVLIVLTLLFLSSLPYLYENIIKRTVNSAKKIDNVNRELLQTEENKTKEKK